ncbi:cache domain-containing protein [Algoriphagus ratkowskyi]|uniref:Cache domain-containing protein n=1 Tax=Algoriphagus ratkowskyi TaxID=57028 RepID=A0A2W7QZ70_9BACT|nr:PDC sensor domain-containing protein [Algoriphagus ratkowskyi]PZX53843.1 cache domain-containing protein [Algoriphagus ratkowskyi]TXD76752.1 Cache sensor protein [Algoriphagus ratkowskyi]
MKLSILWIYPILLFFSSCEPSSKSGIDSSLVIDRSIILEMESELTQLDQEIVFLKDQVEFLLANRDSLLKLADVNKYIFKGGLSTNTPQDSDKLSTLVILNSTTDFEKSMETALVTNSMDSFFKHTYEKYSIVAQVYINTVDQVSRVFPAYDVTNLLDPDLDVTNFNFFYEADLKHNPSRGPVWISEVYVDPAGRGWILSLVHPVFEQGDLLGVLGIDITVDDLIKRYLEDLEGDFLIVNNKGDIVGGNASAIEALSFPPLLNHVYRETINADNFRISNFNLFNSKNNEVRMMAKAIILEKKSHYLFQDEFSPEAAYAVPFSLLDWYLIKLDIRS